MALFAKQSAPRYHQYGFRSLETFNHDGIEIARRRPAEKSGFPWRQTFYFLIAALAFKVFLYLEMGGADYGAKTAELLASDGIERVAGFLMQMDPISQFFIDLIIFGF